MNEMNVEWINPAELTPYAGNAKIHPPEQVEHIANSIKMFGWKQPIVVDGDNVVIIGHGRLLAAKQLMLDTVPVVYATDLTPEQVDALRLADNKTNESEWDTSKLEEELAQLSTQGIDMSQFGFLLEELENLSLDDSEHKGNLKDKFLYPPFSVIRGDKADWLDRKRAWQSFGIKSELGRG